MIYAMSNEMPQNKNVFMKHEPGSRGSKSLRLFEKQMFDVPLPADVKYLDIMVKNVS